MVTSEEPEDDDDFDEVVSDGDITSIPDTGLDDDILVHDQGGQTYDLVVEDCPAMKMQVQHHHDQRHPYHPWNTVNEVWITNLMYTQARMTMTTVDKLLSRLKNGMMKMDGVDFYSSRVVHKILHEADYVLV